MTPVTIKDKNVYYAGKVVGHVIDFAVDGEGLRVLMDITDPVMRTKVTQRVSAGQVSLP